jgi:hypothetical protein
MKQRLYFVLPNQLSAKAIERELLLARVGPDSFGYLARSATALGYLPQAGLLQNSDLVHGIRDGLLSGAVTGAAVGLLLYFMGVQAEPGVMLGMALIGASFGSWAASLVAVSVPNRQLKAFEKDLEEGRILLMVDVPKKMVKEVTELITSRLPQADAQGADPRIPAYCA